MIPLVLFLNKWIQTSRSLDHDLKQGNKMNNAVSDYVMQAGTQAYPHVNSVKINRLWFQLRSQPRIGGL